MTRARVTKRPLIRSIRANVLSLLAGIPVSTFVWSVRSESGLFVLAGVAVAVTIAVEGFYFRSVLRKEDRRLSWRWIIFGNISSNALLSPSHSRLGPSKKRIRSLALLCFPITADSRLRHWL